jgi:NAD(P)-dependent dehydrogenase (short-subunit alcohol dehydrogenase family)
MGAAEACLVALEGARVVLGDLLDAEGKQVEAAITGAGGQALYVHLDVTSETDWEQAVATAVSRFGRLDVLVNNAGVGGGSRLEDTTAEAWDHGMDVNAKGVFLGTKAAIPRCAARGAAPSSTSPPSSAWSAWSAAAPSTRPQGRGAHAASSPRCSTRETHPLQLGAPRPGGDTDRGAAGESGTASTWCRASRSADTAGDESPTASSISPPTGPRS